MSLIDEIKHNLARRHIHISNIGNTKSISDYIRIEAPCAVQALVEFNTEIGIGAYTGIYGGTLRHSRVGRYCSIAREFVSGLDDHPTDRITSSMISYVSDIHGWASYNDIDLTIFREDMHQFRSIRGITEIGNDVWIGHGVFVSSGVSIGDGAIVAARSVVTKDVKPYEIVAGAPARCIRMRFSDKTIERCMRLKWWQYNLFRYKPSLMTDPDRFLDEIEKDRDLGKLEDACTDFVTSADLKRTIQEDY